MGAERRGAAKAKGRADDKVTPEEVQLLAEFAKLVASGNSVSGRGTAELKADSDELVKRMAEIRMSDAGRKKVAESIKEIDDADAFEQASGKLVKYAMFVVMFVPALITLLGSIWEWLSRPTMVVAPAELGGMHAVVTIAEGAARLP